MEGLKLLETTETMMIPTPVVFFYWLQVFSFLNFHNDPPSPAPPLKTGVLGVFFTFLGYFQGGRGGRVVIMKVKKRKHLGGIEEEFWRRNSHSFAHSYHSRCKNKRGRFALSCKSEHAVNGFQRFYIITADI